LDASIPAVPRDRSYSISCGMNWMDDNGNTAPTNGSFGKSTAIQIPGPSQAVVFVDVSANSIDNNEFPYYNNPGDQAAFYKLPTSRHNNGGMFSYADSHAEYHRWLGAVVQGNAKPDASGLVPGPGYNYPTVATDPDLIFIQSIVPKVLGL
jgi:prepilin-type processing-associated H-X9-DG protein